MGFLERGAFSQNRMTGIYIYIPIDIVFLLFLKSHTDEGFDRTFKRMCFF